MDEVSANGRRRVYAVLAHLAACDGVIHPTERSYLDRFAALSEISAEEAAEIERASAQGRGLSIGKNPRDFGGKFIREIICWNGLCGHLAACLSGQPTSCNS